MTGARLIPAAESSLIGMLETVLGPLWVWLLLAERPDAATLTGGALILGALLANSAVEFLVPRRAVLRFASTGPTPAAGRPEQP